MGLTCSKKAFVDTAELVRASSTRKKAHTPCSASVPQNIATKRTPPPVPPRNKKPRFSRTSWGNRSSATEGSSDTVSNNVVRAAGAVDAAVASVRDQGIVVLIRIRPTSQSELDQGQRSFLQVQGATQLHVPASKTTPTEKTCTFDAVLPYTTSQEEVYRVAGPKLIQNLLQGFNATMIAYGQTGSGKTFTMEGTRQDPGVIPRLCKGLFEAIGALGQGKTVAVVASYVEIYNENVVDLLSDAATGGRQSPARKTSPRAFQGSNSVSPAVSPGVSPGVSPTGNGNGRGGDVGALSKPTIRENKDGVYLENVTEQRVQSETAVLDLISRGSSARTKGETQMNAASSRSHAVLTLSLSITEGAVDDGGSGSNVEGVAAAADLSTVRSKISLVDLAGSERAKSTGAAGQRLKEGAQINKSLSALGNVIKALTSGGNAHVPYRDSKLTRLLQDALGGTAYTVVCCNVSPVEASESETLSTLRFAERLKKVKNRMVVHMDARSKEILALRRENAELRARVEHLESMMALGGAGAGPGNGSGNGFREETSSHSGSSSSSSLGSKANSARTAVSASPGPKTPPPVPPRPVP
eukprot:g12605.t1